MKRFCVIGTPVGHSRSPELFERFSAERGLRFGTDVEYLRNEIRTKEELERFIGELRNGEWKGCNVTMPWKTDMVSFMDELSDTAGLTGAVNTVSFRDGKLYGDSTDGCGMLNAIKMLSGQSEEGKNLVILGCGGAARSIIAEAAQRKTGRITIVCRKKGDRPDPSSNLGLTMSMVEKFRGSVTEVEFIDSEDKTALFDELSKADMLINSTPVGMMTGNGDEMKLPLPSETVFDKELIVADCVYNPDETLLIKKAVECGCRTVKGIRMLEEQARCGVGVLLG